MTHLVPQVDQPPQKLVYDRPPNFHYPHRDPPVPHASGAPFPGWSCLGRRLLQRAGQNVLECSPSARLFLPRTCSPLKPRGRIFSSTKGMENSCPFQGSQFTPCGTKAGITGRPGGASLPGRRPLPARGGDKRTSRDWAGALGPRALCWAAGARQAEPHPAKVTRGQPGRQRPRSLPHSLHFQKN